MESTRLSKNLVRSLSSYNGATLFHSLRTHLSFAINATATFIAGIMSTSESFTSIVVCAANIAGIHTFATGC